MFPIIHKNTKKKITNFKNLNLEAIRSPFDIQYDFPKCMFLVLFYVCVNKFQATFLKILIQLCHTCLAISVGRATIYILNLGVMCSSTMLVSEFVVFANFSIVCMVIQNNKKTLLFQKCVIQNNNSRLCFPKNTRLL